MKKLEMSSKLSLLWIFVMFNYLYCDFLTLMDAAVLKEILSGVVGGMEVTGVFLLGASVLMEIPILMVLLSRILKYKLNRILNIIAGVIMISVQLMSLFVGSLDMYYVFFSVVEITALCVIIYNAWKWKVAVEQHLTK